MSNQFEWKWVNLESPKLSASLGTSEFSSLSPLLNAVKAGEIEVLKELLDNGKRMAKLVSQRLLLYALKKVLRLIFVYLAHILLA